MNKENEIVDIIPDNMKEVFSNKLLEILFSTENTNKVPVALRRQTFNLLNNERITSKYGLELLLQQAMIVEPEQTMEVLADTVSINLVLTEIEDLKSKLNARFKLIIPSK